MSMCHPTMRYNVQHKELILSHCHYMSLPSELSEAFGECTEYLDCSHNRLCNLTFLYEFTNLKYLILDNNRLHEAHLSQLQWSLPKVKMLMLNRNELMDLHKTIKILVRIFPNLEYLSLHGNPICPDKLELQPFCEYVDYEYEYYRSEISAAFKNLKFIDHYDLSCDYRKPMAHTELTHKHQNIPKILFWIMLKNNLMKNNVKFIQSQGQRTAALIHTEPIGAFNITDEDL